MNTDPNMSEQPGQTEQSGSQSTTMERTKKKKRKRTALAPKAKHEIMRGHWGRELKDVNLQELLNLFKKTFMPARNVFHSRAQLFNVNQEDQETLYERWKRLMDIKRKCEFNRMTPEVINNHRQEGPEQIHQRSTRTTNRLGNHRIRHLQPQV